MKQVYKNLIALALVLTIAVYLGQYTIIPHEETSLKQWIKEHPNQSLDVSGPITPMIIFLPFLLIGFLGMVTFLIIGIITPPIPDQIEYFERFPGFKP
jgi:hypothetical protein